MSNWNKIKLGDYIDIITDYHANGAYEKLKENITLKYEPDYAIMVRTLNFESNDFKSKNIYLNELEYNYLSKSKVQPYDIIMNKIANPGSVYLMPDLKRPVSLAMNLFLIRFNNKIDQRFIYYLMKFNESYIKRFANGTTTKSITKDAVRELTFKVPNLEIQKKITSLLSNLDAKIELNNKINTELEAMAKTLYDYWFVQFDFPDSTGKPYKTSGGTMVWNEDLKREIPEGWEVNRLDKVMKIVRGASPRPIDDFMASSGIPWIKISDATKSNSRFILLTKEFIKKEGAKKSRELKPGTLILSNSASPGIPKIVEINSCVHDGWLIIDSFKLGFYNEFMFHYFENFREKILNMGTGSIFKNLKTEYIKELLISVPPIHILSESEKILKKISNQILNNSKQNQELASLRDWLLPMLMNGQVSVGEVVREYEVKDEVLGMVAEPNVEYKR